METKGKTEEQPFLGFRDDSTKCALTDNDDAENGINSYPRNEPRRISRSWHRGVIRDCIVGLVTSVVWILAFIFFMKYGAGPTAPLSSSAPTAMSSPPEVGMDREGSRVSTAKQHNITSNSWLETCGNSAAEAKEKGCKYDALLNAWVPARCLDQEWINEYKDDDTWTAFADEDLTQPLSASTMGDHEFYYTSIQDHANHCAVLWRKQYWTLFEHRAVFDDVIVSSFHTEHCAEFLKDLYGLNRTEPTMVKVMFSGCWVRGKRPEGTESGVSGGGGGGYRR